MRQIAIQVESVLEDEIRMFCKKVNVRTENFRICVHNMRSATMK